MDGIHPNYVQSLSQIHSILSLVSAGTGLAVVPSSASVLGFPETEFRSITEKHPTTSELFVAWREDNANPVVPHIADLVIACGQQEARSLLQRKPA